MFDPNEILRQQMILALVSQKPLKSGETPYSERSTEDLRTELYDLVNEEPKPAVKAMTQVKEAIIDIIHQGDRESLKANSDEKVSVGGHLISVRYWPNDRLWEWDGFLRIQHDVNCFREEYFADAYQEADKKGKRPLSEEESDSGDKDQGDRTKRGKVEEESKLTSQAEV